jgi:hypothetical protein
MKLVLATLVASVVASGIAFAAVAGPVGPAAPGAEGAAAKTPITPQCFYTRDMRNHTVGSANEMYIDVQGRGVYRVTMSNACLAGAVSSDPIILRNITGSQSICRPLDLDISIAHGGGMKTPCIVSSIALMAPAEVQALPKHMRP